MATSKLKLTVVSQEKQLLDTEVEQLTVPGSQGEMTILPHHASLFSRLSPGELQYLQDGAPHSFVVSKGFIDVNNDNTATVIVDTATAARDISVEKAQEAIKQAKETMSHSEDRRELLLAEASLKHAMLEIQVAQRSKKNKL